MASTNVRITKKEIKLGINKPRSRRVLTLQKGAVKRAVRGGHDFVDSGLDSSGRQEKILGGHTDVHNAEKKKAIPEMGLPATAIRSLYRKWLPGSAQPGEAPSSQPPQSSNVVVQKN